MKRLFTLFIIYFIINSIYGQSKDLYKNYDCYTHVRNKNPASLDYNMELIQCIARHDNYDKAIRLLDSLINIYPDSGKLYWFKAICKSEHNIYDTTCISFYKKAIDLNYNLSDCYYNMACNYYNFLVVCEYKNSPCKLKLNEKLKLLDLAEENYIKSININQFDKAIVLGVLANIKYKRDTLTGVKQKELSYPDKFDTITIITSLLDCGEFGGHLENIKIYHLGKDIVGVLSLDSIYCQPGMQRDTKLDTSFKFTEQIIDSNLIKDYIKDFKSIKKRQIYAWTNAPYSFWIYIDSDVYFIQGFKEESKFYTYFKDKIFR